MGYENAVRNSLDPIWAEGISAHTTRTEEQWHLRFVLTNVNIRERSTVRKPHEFSIAPSVLPTTSDDIQL